jgi:hypothetical protein
MKRRSLNICMSILGKEYPRIFFPLRGLERSIRAYVKLAILRYIFLRSY